jgi:hypothetical protein
VAGQRRHGFARGCPEGGVQSGQSPFGKDEQAMPLPGEGPTMGFVLSSAAVAVLPSALAVAWLMWRSGAPIFRSSL